MKRPTAPKSPIKRREPKPAKGASAKSHGPKGAGSKGQSKKHVGGGSRFAAFRAKSKQRRAARAARARAEGRKGPPRNIFARLAYWGLILTLWLAAGLVGLGVIFAYDLPDTKGLTSVARSPSVTLIAVDGSEIASRGDLYGLPVKVEDLPIYVEQAVLATEDRRFYHHFGFDPIGFTRAMITNVRAGSLVQGGSTITQQLAKNVFLTADRTFTRKGKELLLAFWLEYRFTKKEILSLYLNRVYLGAGTYGIDAAAQKYFGVDARDLTLQQSAMIAGLLKAPSRYAPTNNLKRSQGRAAQVIDNMVAAGYIDDATAKAAKAKPAHPTRSATNGAPRYYIDWVLDRLTDYIGHANDDLVVYTTLDPKMQALGTRVVRHWVLGEGKRLKVEQGAFVMMNHQGAVLAMVGGTSYAKSQYNRATQAERQPGSAFKPFVYLAAMEYGLHPGTVRRDSPVTFGNWSPRNYSGKYEGNITLDYALSHSINTVAVKVSEESGRMNVIDAAHRAGITKELPSTPSVALGAGEVTLLELTGAYVPFATGGRAAFVHGIERIETKQGEVLYKRSGSGPGRITGRSEARDVATMLRSTVEEGTGKNARLRGGRPAWGKTGTSQDSRDAWFIGFTQNYVAGVWVGNDDNSPMRRVTGGGLPALIWRDVMNSAYQGQAVTPSERDRVTPDSGSGPVDNILDDIFDSIFGI